METIEKDYESLRGVVSQSHICFDDSLLDQMPRTFNNDALKSADGDFFWRIYAYFLLSRTAA